MADEKKERADSPFAGSQDVPATDAPQNPQSAGDNLRLDSQGQQASQISKDAQRASINKQGGDFYSQLVNLIGHIEPTADEAIDAELDRKISIFEAQNGRIPTLAEWQKLQAETVTTLNNFEDSATEVTANRYRKLAYNDELDNFPPAIPEASVLLPGDKIVRYAENDPESPRQENDNQVFLIDALIYIQGVEVSEFLQGTISVSMSGTDGHNHASFTLDNSGDRFVWSERNLFAYHGKSAQQANAPYIQEINEYIEELNRELRVDSAVFATELETEEISRRIQFTQDEAIKEAIYDYKTGIDENGRPRNPPIRNPKNTLTFARFDLAPGRPIFNRMDPVRIFSLYPFRVPGREWEQEVTGSVGGAIDDEGEFIAAASRELWMPEFTGYIDNVSFEDDEVRGASRITIDCVDFREAVLRRMRVSTDLTSGLGNPLDALGFRLSPAAQAGTRASQTAQDQRLQEDFRNSTDGFYDINNTQFYDDILVNPFNQPFPNKPLEEAVREVLVANEPVTTERNNRGVRGVEFGGTFYYDNLNFTRREAQDFLEYWHKFCLFGPKRRPWTREEVEQVGSETTTDGVRAPNKSRLWFLLPIEGSGPSNLANLSQVSIQMSHDVAWNNRLEIIQNFVSALDYNFMVTPYGDMICEFTMADFRPEDFGEFKQSFRFDKGLTSSQFGAEQEAPPAGLIVEIGFAAGAGPPPAPADTFLTKVFVYSPYIAARYGIEIDTESIPFLLARDKAVAQQRAVMLYQRRLARSHAMSLSASYRPFLLPNRPVHHIRRHRMGSIVSMDKTLTLGSAPQGEVSVGLEHVRLFSGHYRSAADFQSLNAIQQEDLSSKGINPNDIATIQGIDPTSSPDPLELQVFTTVAAGESTPTSARIGWGNEAVLAPASGIYVLDLAKVREANYQPSEQPVDEVAAEDVGDFEPPAETPPPEPSTYKFAANPLDVVYVKSNFGPRTLRGRAGNHTGLDLRALTPTPCYAVESGTIIRAGRQPAPGTPIGGLTSYGSGGNIVLLQTDSGFWVQYLHLDDSTRTLGLQFGQRVTAGQQIGITGRSGEGSATGAEPHLHIDVFALTTAIEQGRTPEGTTNQKKLDPRPFLPGPVTGIPPRTGEA